MNVLVEDWMTRRVATVKPLDSLQHARELLEQHRINQLPVLAGAELAGILTDRDVRDAFPSVFDFAPTGESRRNKTATDPAKVAVESVMSPNVCTIGPKETIFAAARVMGERRIGAVPVVAGGKLVGILTRSDLLRALVALGETGAR
jgi:acetoin utilization protein AcuB